MCSYSQVCTLWNRTARWWDSDWNRTVTEFSTLYETENKSFLFQNILYSLKQTRTYSWFRILSTRRYCNSKFSETEQKSFLFLNILYSLKQQTLIYSEFSALSETEQEDIAIQNSLQNTLTHYTVSETNHASVNSGGLS